MSRKNKSYKGNIVYSTDPDRVEEEIEEQETLLPGEQKLKIRLDTKHRKGKTVTLVDGFTGTKSDLEGLGKKLKSHCGTGGSAKDGIILIQGDVREKVKIFLEKEGYRVR